MDLSERKTMLLFKENLPFLVYFLLFSWNTIITCSAQSLSSNTLLGIQFISFTNFDGTISNGNCCDEPEKQAGSCTPNLCDTAFILCGIRYGHSACDTFNIQWTEVTYNKNSWEFGAFIGNGIYKTTSLLVMKFPYSDKPINFVIRAVDVSEKEDNIHRIKQLIASFNFTFDWLNSTFLTSPIFRRYVLNDTRAQLVVDVVSQCSKHYFTDDCSVYCRPDKIHYTCMDNGTIQCLPGWAGPQCLEAVMTTTHGSIPNTKTTRALAEHETTTYTNTTQTSTEKSSTINASSEYASLTYRITTHTTPPENDSTTFKTTTETSVSTNFSIATSAPQGQQTRCKSQSSDSDGDDGPVIGISVGVVCGVALLAAALVLWYVVRRNKKRAKVMDETENTQMSAPKA